MLKGEENLPLLDHPQRIVITTHHKPDGDALGSSLGLYHWLRKHGHEVEVIVSSDFPEFLDWMPERNNVSLYTADTYTSQRRLDKTDITFCYDHRALSRANILEPVIRQASAQKWMIAHHLDPTDF